MKRTVLKLSYYKYLEHLVFAIAKNLARSISKPGEHGVVGRHLPTQY